MPRQHRPAMFVDFAERDRLEPARPFQAKREAADPAEKIEHAQLPHHSAPTHLRAEWDFARSMAAARTSGVTDMKMLISR